MKYLQSVLLTLCVLVLASAVFAQRNFAGKVVEVVDGKTVVIELTGGGKLTAVLQYIEVPEPEQQLSQTVRDHLGQLVLGNVVVFRGGSISTGTLIVGELRRDGVDISQQMLRDGAAWHIPASVSGQLVDQGAVYADNQAMAKEQKLGIWSVPGMKPAWEFRAEKEEAARQKALAEMPKPAPEATPEVVTKTKRHSVEDQLKANARAELWPNVNLGVRDQSTGLAKDFDPVKKIGYFESRGVLVEMTAPKSSQKIECRAMYFYQTSDGGGVLGGGYVIGFLSQSKDNIFLKSNNLVVFADGKKFNIGPAKVTGKKGEYGVAELLFYKVSDDDMQEIAYADKLEVKIGAYTGVIGGELKNSMRHLLLAKRN
jgi:endonuclease YncB( thermonuclease family)